ncbi:MAG TPA: RDD family protein [Micromonosporaceae bacterium]|nr:RDD family protein [Micromonosporaceae bacterium]
MSEPPGDPHQGQRPPGPYPPAPSGTYRPPVDSPPAAVRGPAPVPAPGAAVEAYGHALAPLGAPRTDQPVSAGGRFAGAVVEVLLIMVTLGIGWWIWAAFTWSTGQTPAKRLLGYVVVDADTGARFTWERMFLREFLIKGIVLPIGSLLTCSVLTFVDGFMVFGERRRTLHDMMAGSIVGYE